MQDRWFSNKLTQWPLLTKMLKIKNICWRKNSLFNKWFWRSWVSMCRRMKLNPYLLPCMKIHLKLKKKKQINKSTSNRRYIIGLDYGSIKRTKASLREFALNLQSSNSPQSWSSRPPISHAESNTGRFCLLLESSAHVSLIDILEIRSPHLLGCPISTYCSKSLGFPL